MSVIVGEPVTPDDPGEWFSIQEAARHLSVSERTVYRRADRGQLRRRTLPDGRVEVMVPLTRRPDVSDVPSDIDSQERAVTLVDRVSAAVSRQLESLTVELAASRERIEVLARENGTLGERVLGLERELTDVRQVADSDRQRLTSERDAALVAAQAQQEVPTAVEPAPASVEPHAPWMRRYWPLALTVAGFVVLVALLTWPR